MDPAAILIRRNNTFARLVILFVMAGVGFAQESPLATPPLTLRSGTILTVRINEPLSSDHNQFGDVFSATLTQPVIAQGIVVARYGQTVAGQVVEAKKAGRVSGVSRLAVTLTNMTLVDGQSVPVRSQMLVRRGPTSEGRDAAGVAGATGLGASIGAAADWGTGAAIGAGAGAAAGVIGALLTRGYPTVIEPETLLTFQVTAPVTIETKYAPQAFRFVGSADYPPAQTPSQEAPLYPTRLAYPYPYRVYYVPLSYPYYYPYSYFGYPYFGGPSFNFFFGYPGYYRYGGYYGYHFNYGHVNAPRPFPYRGGTIAHTFHGGPPH